MRTCAILAVIGSMCLGSAADVQAQRSSRRGNSSRRFENQLGMLSLLNIPEVQIELSTRPEQMQLVFSLQSDLREQVRNTFFAAQSERPERPPGESDPDPERRREASVVDTPAQLRRVERTADSLLAAILDDQQLQRLTELWFRREGVRVWTRPDVSDRLALTETQRMQIEELLKSLTAETNEQALSLLTDRQGELWKQMQGEDFTFPTRPRR